MAMFLGKPNDVASVCIWHPRCRPDGQARAADVAVKDSPTMTTMNLLQFHATILGNPQGSIHWSLGMATPGHHGGVSMQRLGGAMQVVSMREVTPDHVLRWWIHRSLGVGCEQLPRRSPSVDEAILE
jgi:hypothetical protein